MLDLGGDEVLALLVLVGAHYTLDGPVVGLGATGGEEDLRGPGGVDDAGDVLARLLDGVLGLLAQLVDGAGVTELLAEVGKHCLHNLRAARSGCRVVQINALHGIPPSFLFNGSIYLFENQIVSVELSIIAIRLFASAGVTIGMQIH